LVRQRIPGGSLRFAPGTRSAPELGESDKRRLEMGRNPLKRP